MIAPKIHFITRGRSARGGHVILTNIYRELLKRGLDASLTVFETPDTEMTHEIWKDLPVEVIKLEKTESREKKHVVEQEAYGKHLSEALGIYDHIIIDGWLLVLAATKVGAHKNQRLYQLVQSDPRFAPENPSKIWKAELFGALPHIPMRRIVVSENMRNLFKTVFFQKTESLPIFIQDEFHKKNFSVKHNEPLHIISSSATFNIPEKGLKLLLDTLETFEAFPFKLTLVSGDDIKLDLSKYHFKIDVAHAKNPAEMISLLQSCDIYINTSTKEAFGLAQAEAITLGVPSIVLDAVGNRDFINGENAIFVNDPKNLSSELAKMADVELRKTLNSKAKSSMSKYTLDRTIDELINVLAI